jgi:hypothetical protein
MSRWNGRDQESSDTAGRFADSFVQTRAEDTREKRLDSPTLRSLSGHGQRRVGLLQACCGSSVLSSEAKAALCQLAPYRTLATWPLRKLAARLPAFLRHFSVAQGLLERTTPSMGNSAHFRSLAHLVGIIVSGAAVACDSGESTVTGDGGTGLTASFEMALPQKSQDAFDPLKKWTR